MFLKTWIRNIMKNYYDKKPAEWLGNNKIQGISQKYAKCLEFCNSKEWTVPGLRDPASIRKV